MPSHSGMPEKTACNVCNVSHSFHREETDTETQRSGLRLIDRENTWMRVGKILLMPDGSGLPFLLCTGRGYKQFLFFGAYKCRWPASQHHVPSFPRASQSLTLPNPWRFTAGPPNQPKHQHSTYEKVGLRIHEHGYRIQRFNHCYLSRIAKTSRVTAVP
jgi:hypothetical protein